MPIPTSRTYESGHVVIDQEKCTGCGLCAEVCSDAVIEMIDGKAVATHRNSLFGCIGCGQCMAVCPEGAVSVTGRWISPDDVFPLADRSESASYDSLLKLYQRRRSIRDFKDKPVEPELVEKILQAAVTAPMGIPPSDVNVLVLNSKEKVFQFSKDYCDYLENLKWMVSPLGLLFMRLFYGKENGDMFRDFIKPVINAYTGNMKEGKNIVMYDAPLAFYFYGSPYTDPADPIIACTYAMHAAESLGLGTCMLGAIHPFIQSGGAAKKFREKHGIRFKSKEGLFLIVGYPKVKFRNGIKRTFAGVEGLN
ncbi:MAG TPA: nitroreductase family protein [Bacteroidales bacterium]|nr:nitroreductase family protein [Bacteroidales bacterium]